MRRTISGLRRLWSALMAATLVVLVYEVLTVFISALPSIEVPFVVPMLLVGLIVCLVLIGVAPRSSQTEPIQLASPVRGRWAALNSPGQALPSHGTRTRGQLSAVDICVPADDGSPPIMRRGWLGTRPEDFESFGQPFFAMAAGTVVRVRDSQRDHRARNTWPGLIWMMTGEGFVREALGTSAVLGNHIVVDHGDGTFAAYAHVQRGSAAVVEGERLDVGARLGRIGNTGNTSMPHLHVQLMDRAYVDAAAGIPMTWRDIILTGDLDKQFASFAAEPDASALPSMPRNAEIFVTLEGDSG